MTKKTLTVPKFIAIAGALLMLLCIFLPYGSANEDYAERFSKLGDIVIYEEANVTAEDMINVSLLTFTNIYYTENLYDTGILYGILLAVFGTGTLLTLLFSFLKKPIVTAIISLIPFAVFNLLNFDFTDRGVISGDAYNWGIAYYLFYIAFIMVLAGAIWMLVNKIKANQQKS